MTSFTSLIVVSVILLMTSQGEGHVCDEYCELEDTICDSTGCLLPNDPFVLFGQNLTLNCTVRDSNHSHELYFTWRDDKSIPAQYQRVVSPDTLQLSMPIMDTNLRRATFMCKDNQTDSIWAQDVKFDYPPRKVREVGYKVNESSGAVDITWTSPTPGYLHPSYTHTTAIWTATGAHRWYYCSTSTNMSCSIAESNLTSMWYNVSIATNNTLTHQSVSQAVHFYYDYVAENEPLVSPVYSAQACRGESNSRNISIFLKPGGGDHLYGSSSSYLVEYTPSDEQNSVNFTSNIRPQLHLSNIRCNVSYDVNVTIRTPNNESSSFLNVSKAGTVPKPNKVLVAIDARSTKVNWEVPSGGEMPVGFTVFWCRGTRGVDNKYNSQYTPDWEEVDGSSRNLTVNTTDTMMMYSVSMTTKYGKSELKWSDCTYISKNEPGKSQIQTVISRPSLSLTVGWTPHTCENFTLITSYSIHYCRDNHTCDQVNVSSDHSQHVISNLEAGAQYSVRLAKVTATGRQGKLSDPVIGVPVTDGDKGLGSKAVTTIAVITAIVLVIVVVSGTCCARKLWRKCRTKEEIVVPTFCEDGYEIKNITGVNAGHTNSSTAHDSGICSANANESRQSCTVTNELSQIAPDYSIFAENQISISADHSRVCFSKNNQNIAFCEQSVLETPCCFEHANDMEFSPSKTETSSSMTYVIATNYSEEETDNSFIDLYDDDDNCIDDNDDQESPTNDEIYFVGNASN